MHIYSESNLPTHHHQSDYYLTLSKKYAKKSLFIMQFTVHFKMYPSF